MFSVEEQKGGRKISLTLKVVLKIAENRDFFTPR